MRTSALAALLLAGCGQPLLYARVDEPSLAITQSLPAVPGAPAVDVPSATIPPGGFDLDLGGLPVDAAKDSRLTLNGAAVAMVGAGAGTSFSGLRSAELQIVPDAGSGLQPVTIASYDQVRDGAAGSRLAFVADGSVNLLPYLSSKKLKVQVVVAGIPPGPPGSDWNSDLTVDVHLLAQVQVR